MDHVMAFKVILEAHQKKHRPEFYPPQTFKKTPDMLTCHRDQHHGGIHLPTHSPFCLLGKQQYGGSCHAARQQDPRHVCSAVVVCTLERYFRTILIINHNCYPVQRKV